VSAPDGVSSLKSVVSKIIPILEAVASAENGIGVREIARRTGIDKSAISRLLKQFEELSVVDQSEASGRFYVGPRLEALGAMMRDRGTVWRHAEPILSQLSERFDETCYLVMREGQQARFKERIDCKQTIRYVIEEDAVSPLHAGAAGRAILAGMSPDEVDAYLSGTRLEKVTGNTMTSRAKVRAMAVTDRENGYSVSHGERVVGGVGVASPFFRADGYCMGAVLWTCPAQRCTDATVDEACVAVAEAAKTLSGRLGYATDEAKVGT
jgi:DNA-binding IclR family transcriptional regulator